ncbi:MAG: hypothetical protein AAF320_03865 [Myxococcota bacterium]
MQITRRVKDGIVHGVLFSIVLGMLFIGSGCDKIQTLQVPNIEQEADQSKVDPKPIIPMQKTLDKLKSRSVSDQEEALQAIQDWLNDGYFNDKDVKAKEALLEYIASSAPLVLRARAVGMLMSSGDDRAAGGVAKKALAKQLNDAKKGAATVWAMVEFASNPKAPESHRKEVYDLCIKSSRVAQPLAKKLVGSDKGSSQAIKKLMEKDKNPLSSDMQDAIGKEFLRVVEIPEWSPHIDHFKSVVLFLKDKMNIEKYIRFLLHFSLSPKREIRDLLAEETFRDGIPLHQHKQIVVDALTDEPVDSLSAKAIVEMIHVSNNLVLIGEVLLDSKARERVDKTGIALAAALVTHIEGLVDELKASVLLERTTLVGVVPILWNVNLDANRRDRAKATLKKHVSHLHVPELKDAFENKLRELTAFPNIENIRYRYQAGLAGAPAGQFNVALNPAVPVDLNGALRPLHQTKFGVIVVVLTEFNNAQLNQHLRDQAARIRRGLPAAAWALP